MPGKRSANLGQGYRCEYMAQYSLSAYASVVPILLQEDYGHDFYCLLTEKQGAMLIPRFPFVVQIKKNDSGKYGTLTYDNEDSINWFFGFNLPFFIGLGYLDESPRLDLYKTSERIALNLSHGLPKEVTLHSGKNPDSPAKLYDENNIWMGDPVITIKLDSCGKPDGDISDALTFWVELEVGNLVLQSNSITRFYRCKNYETNKRPGDSEITGKDWYNTGGISEDQAEKFGAVLQNMALWLFAGQDIESPKTPWVETSSDQRNLYNSIVTLLQFLSKDSATRLSSILKYPIQQTTVTPAIKTYSGVSMTASIDVE